MHPEERTCVHCKINKFTTSGRTTKKYCETCRPIVTREKEKARKKERGTGRGIYSNLSIKEIALSCGHTVYFRILPEPGSLWCSRCDKWILYKPNLIPKPKYVDLCKNGHKRTKKNTRIDKNGWRECLICRSNSRKRKYRRDKREKVSCN